MRREYSLYNLDMMEKNMVEAVMYELLEEEKLGNIKADQIAAQLNSLSSEVKEFKRFVAGVKLNVPAINTTPIEAMFFNHLQTLKGEFTELKKFVTLERKRKQFREMLYQWLPWILVMVLCAVIFQIAIGGNYHGTIF